MKTTLKDIAKNPDLLDFVVPSEIPDFPDLCDAEAIGKCYGGALSSSIDLDEIWYECEICDRLFQKQGWNEYYKHTHFCDRHSKEEIKSYIEREQDYDDC